MPRIRLSSRAMPPTVSRWRMWVYSWTSSPRSQSSESPRAPTGAGGEVKTVMMLYGRTRAEPLALSVSS